MKPGTINKEACEAALKGLVEFECSVPCNKCKSTVRNVKTERCAPCDKAKNKLYVKRSMDKKARNAKMLAQSKSRKEKRYEIYKVNDKLMHIANQAFLIARGGV